MKKIILLLTFLLILPVLVNAQLYHTQTLHVKIYLPDEWGKPTILENKPGGNEILKFSNSNELILSVQEATSKQPDKWVNQPYPQQDETVILPELEEEDVNQPAYKTEYINIEKIEDYPVLVTKYTTNRPGEAGLKMQAQITQNEYFYEITLFSYDNSGETEKQFLRMIESFEPTVKNYVPKGDFGLLFE